MEFDPKKTLAVIYALRFKIKHLESVASDISIDEDGKIDAEADCMYLQWIADTMEAEYRQHLGLKPDDAI